MKASVTGAGAAVVPAEAAAELAPMYLCYRFNGLSLSVEELEVYALARLRVFKAAHLARMGGSAASAAGAQHVVSELVIPDVVVSTIRKAERDEKLAIPRESRGAAGENEKLEAMMRDEASHFILRLALAKTQEMRKWLIHRECELFSARVRHVSTGAVLQALQKACPSDAPRIRPCTDAELRQFGAAMDCVAKGVQRGKHQHATHYRVAFDHVLHLVGRRQVFLSGGDAFVPEPYIHDILVGQFRARLSSALNVISRALYGAETHPAMGPLLNLVRAHWLVNERAQSKQDRRNDATQDDLIDLSQLEDSVNRMPLCMQALHYKLKETHHLRHQARLQLGLFLKGCGLSMDESLKFWRMEFEKNGVTSDKFEKEYAYSIRHHYGKEGKRKNLSPYGCMNIINRRPGPGEFHGCPYREFGEERLLGLLRTNGLPEGVSREIAQKSKESHFQLACALTLKHQHGSENASSPEHELTFIEHPNEYFIVAGRMERERLGIAMEPPLVSIEPTQSIGMTDRAEPSPSAEVEPSLHAPAAHDAIAETSSGKTDAYEHHGDTMESERDERQPADRQDRSDSAAMQEDE
ncbi:putative DNA primase large subunit [Porphyridium purpureum]|uniref:Putative DNA primase large subunit n=1 Tax=Porphyridium purpureum TaxID=35688 RepID=A0A5J4YPV3_PORPP|nr:putative DNA primase large subunit [Porphyridium purpureum]|eukprot:POR9893..scf296_7